MLFCAALPAGLTLSRYPWAVRVVLSAAALGDGLLRVLTRVQTVLATLAGAIGTGVVVGLILRWLQGRHGPDPWIPPAR